MNAKQVFAHPASVLETARGEGREKDFAPVEHIEEEWHFVVPQVRELVGGELPIRFPGMSAYER